MFSSIIGHQNVCSVLSRQIESGQMAHAYLFVGPEGVGKSAVTSEFIGTLVPSGTDATKVARNFDEKTEKLKSSISVEQIRELRERLSLTSFDGSKKMVFIEEADYLSDSAANALLKTLEEPRGDTCIILRAETVESVPETIASRCQILRFHLVSEKIIGDALRTRGLDQEETTKIATMSRGRPGVAIRLIRDGAYRAERETASATFQTIISSSLAKRLGLVASLLPKTETDKSTALEKILDTWEEVARDRMLAGDTQFTPILDRIQESREAMEFNINPQLALEHVVI